MYGFLLDTTKRRLVEQELVRSQSSLRALAARIQVAREDEKLKASREIHDVLGQAFTAIRLNLMSCIEMLPAGLPEIREKAAGMVRLCDDMIIATRQLAHKLRPSILDDLGLMAALRSEASALEERASLDCVIECDGDAEAIGKGPSLAILRICQEALTNVARHAEATKVTINVTNHDGRTYLTVRDDGIGFDAPSKQFSLGLIGMKERAIEWDGEVVVESALGVGTTIRVFIPRRVMSL